MMPAHGDQHKPTAAPAATTTTTTHNPFEETKQVVSEYTAQEIATLQSRLNKRLGPEYISTRTGPGNQKVAYLSAEKAINLANEVFGFNGWSSSIQNIQIDFVDENQNTGKVSIGLSVVVRVTLRDGTYHEDIGYGGIENCKGKIAAFEKAKKEGTTDALKRALRSFGNVLGNCIYDRDYITKVSRVKAGAGKWDVNELHRHPDFAPKSIEGIPALEQPPMTMPGPASSKPSLPLTSSDSFDMNDFDDVDLDDVDFGGPDEVVLPTEQEQNLGRSDKLPVPNNTNHNNANTNVRQMTSNNATPSKPPTSRPQVSAQVPAAPGGNDAQSRRPNPPSRAATGPARPMPSANNTNASALTSGPGQTEGTSVLSRPPSPTHLQQGPNSSGSGPAVPQLAGFYSAKAAATLDPSNRLAGAETIQKFNPHAESPSIRKTSGVDHTKSMALNRHTLKPELLPPNPTSNSNSHPHQPAAPQKDFGKDIPDLRGDHVRKMGVPGHTSGSGLNSPGGGGGGGFGRGRGMGTSAYRPPTRHPVPQAPNTSATGTSVGVAAGTGAGVGNPSAGAGAGAGPKRPPLNDVSNLQHQHQHQHNVTASTGDGADVKRQRLSGSHAPTSAVATTTNMNVSMGAGVGVGHAENMKPAV